MSVSRFNINLHALNLCRIIFARCRTANLELAGANPVTAATSAILVLLNGAIAAADVAAFALKVIRMTGGAEGCVLGEGPGYRGAYGRAVTGITARVPAVIARIVSIRVMAEDGRRPAVGGMTYVALLSSGQMRGNRVYLSSRVTAIMASVAIIGTAGVVRPAAADEGCGSMTGGAIQAGREVGGHCIDLALGGIAIMAGLAIADDTGMVESRRDEAARSMADAAILAGFDVAGFLRCGETDGVTGGTVIDDADVIEACRPESRGLMAVDAVAVCRHMVVMLALGEKAVVTGSAVIDDALVFEPGIGKGRGRVTGRAILRDRNMRWIGLGTGAGCSGTIVAGCAIIDDAVMVEYGRFKGTAGGMTDAAILRCRYMVWFGDLADRVAAVMAGIAAHGQHRRIGVVDKRICKSRRVMTHHAVRGGCRVRRTGCLAPGAEGHKARAAVVTRSAIAADIEVRKCRWLKAGYRMANVTILRGRQMTCRLGQRRISGEKLVDVAAFATVADARMQRGKKRRRRESSRAGVVVALAALIDRGDMVRLLADGSGRDIIGAAVVAAFAIAADTDVCEIQRGLERRTRAVASNAILGRRDVAPRLACADVTVVAGYAIAGNARVAEYRSAKGRGAEMAVRAILAIGSRRNVMKRLARADHVVMAVGAVHGYPGVIIGAGGKGSRSMTRATIQRGRHVGVSRGARRHSPCRS